MFPRLFRCTKNAGFRPFTTSSCATLINSRVLVIDDFEAINSVGKGSYGTVYQVEDKITAASLALKVVPKADVNSRDISAERKTLQGLAEARSPWLLSLRGSFHDSENYYMLTDYHAAGDMFQQFKRTGAPTYDQVRLIIAELIVALEALHEKKIIHRDVKPENILVDDTGHIVLADFGLARDFQHGFRSKRPELSSVFMTDCRCGSPAYMSPEMWKGENYSFEADFWAIGIIMYYLLTFRLPFQLENPTDWDTLQDSVCEDPLTFRMYDKVDAAAKDFLFKSLKKSRNARLSPGEMKAHRYFDGIDFEQVARREFTAPFDPQFDEPSPFKLRTFIVSGQPLAEDNRGDWFSFVDSLLEPPAPLSPVYVSFELVESVSTGEWCMPIPSPTTRWRKLFRRCVPLSSFVHLQYANIKKTLVPISMLAPRIPRGKTGSRTRRHAACRGSSWLFLPQVRKV
jgi:serine/threonine protein kinase